MTVLESLEINAFVYRECINMRGGYNIKYFKLNTLRYQIRRASIKLWRSKSKMAINIICTSLGLIIAALFICQANGALNSISSDIEFIKWDNVAVAKPIMGNNFSSVNKNIQIHDVNDIVEGLEYVSDVTIVNRITGRNLRVNNKFIVDHTMLSVSDNFDNFFAGDFVNGNWINGYEDCVVGKNLLDKYNLSIGDKVELDEISYIISGIINVPKYNMAVFVDENSISNLSIYDAQYYFKLTDLSNRNILNLDNYIQDNYYKHTIKTKDNVIEEAKAKIKKGWIPSIIIAVLALAYGVVNVGNIEKFFIEEEIREIAIMSAYGMSRNQIIFQKLIKSVCVAFFASIITIFSMYILQFTDLNYLFLMKVDFNAFLILFVLTLFLSIFITYVLVRKYLKRSISRIIQEIN